MSAQFTHVLLTVVIVNKIVELLYDTENYKNVLRSKEKDEEGKIK